METKIRGRLKGVLLLFISSISIFLFSCTDKEVTNGDDDIVARVNKKYLDRDELSTLIPVILNSKDSVSITHRFIDKWASKQLMLDISELNLSEDKKEEVDKLVENFKYDLMIKAYLEELVQSKIDTVVSMEDLKEYYQKNKSNFIVEDKLVQLTYVNVLPENSYFASIKKKFKSSNKSEYNSLEKLSLQLKTHHLNDSVWVDLRNIFIKLPFINEQNQQEYLKTGNYFEYDDGDSVYLVNVKEVLGKGKTIPFSFVQNGLRALVINHRKIELVKQIQEDILKDAKNNKRYEIF